MASVSVHNFGCRANQAEGAALAAALAAAGAADWIVLNTCTVTAAADAEARHAIRRLRREHPEAKIAVTGCYAQRALAEVSGLEGVALAVGRIEAAELARRLAPEAPPMPPKLATAARLERTRPVVKVQEGCDRRCAYCIVPMVRGAHRSVPVGDVLAQIETLVAAGHREVVISGINLGQWGQDLDGGLRLPDLVGAILERTPLPRLRLSSVEPMDWSEAMSELLAHPRVARHAHLPLQSGSDAVLARMRRRYRAAQYAERVLGLLRRAPLAAIGADVMAGFPGETEAEFEETRAFVAAMPFTYLHVFRFSRREGTAAAEQLAAGTWAAVPEPVAAERAAALRRLGAEKRAAFLAGLVGQRLPAITLQAGPAVAAARCDSTAAVAATAARGWALSDNFCNVVVPERVAANQLCTVEIRAARGHYLEGRRVSA